MKQVLTGSNQYYRPNKFIKIEPKIWTEPVTRTEPNLKIEPESIYQISGPNHYFRSNQIWNRFELAEEWQWSTFECNEANFGFVRRVVCTNSVLSLDQTVKSGEIFEKKWKFGNRISRMFSNVCIIEPGIHDIMYLIRLFFLEIWRLTV